MTETGKQPNLEQRVAAAEAADGAAFKYRPIKADEKYDRDTFVRAYNQFNDLGEYLQAIEKDPTNPGARDDLSELLYGDPGFVQGASPEDVKRTAEDAYKDGFDSMTRHVERNRIKFLELLDNKAMYELLMAVSLYKNGTHEHDALVGLINEVKSMAAITQAENPIGQMAKYIVDKTAKSDSTPRWAKSLISRFSGDQNFVQRVFLTGLSAKEKVLSDAFSDGKGIDGTKARKVLEASLDRAYEEINSADNSSKEKRDVWEKVIRPYYAILAQMVYKVEDKEMKAGDEAEVKKKERKAERKSAGIAA